MGLVHKGSLNPSPILHVSRANTSELGPPHEKKSGAKSPTAHSQEPFGLRVFAIIDTPI